MTQNVWLITGTSSGFGRRFVLSALRRGDKVIATSRTLDATKNLSEQIRSEVASTNGAVNGSQSKIMANLDSNLRLLQLDINWSTEEIQAKVKEAIDIWGRVDILVNNAGTGFKGIVEEVSSKHFREQFQTNLFGIIDVTNAVLPSMRARRSGTIVMIASRSSWKCEIPSTSMYTSSKAALRVFSETLACEIAPFSIRTLIVEPGAFRTERILSQPYIDDHLIPDYDAMRNKVLSAFKAIDGKQKGDPDKGVELVVDVVRGEGKALKADGTLREWPIYLPLGGDSMQDIRNKCTLMLKTVDQWADVTSTVEFDEENV
ncbi:NAD(P)-binding protein [Dendrothele bispora CBS 962.96]|uniref:NAD(P)-binding protein n=1 Tax=Dendrothele bispora (strain CBS 962.96) TaxID=1314807 RepID=A0A4S8L256_DENBC|nr:NAD(P)-binding protein [Dendrothele bispora CBS 962.96]